MNSTSAPTERSENCSSPARRDREFVNRSALGLPASRTTRGTFLLSVSPSLRHLVQQPMAKPDLVLKYQHLKVAGCSPSVCACSTGFCMCAVHVGLFLYVRQGLQARGCMRMS